MTQKCLQPRLHHRPHWKDYSNFIQRLAGEEKELAAPTQKNNPSRPQTAPPNSNFWLCLCVQQVGMECCGCVENITKKLTESPLVKNFSSKNAKFETVKPIFLMLNKFPDKVRILTNHEHLQASDTILLKIYSVCWKTGTCCLAYFFNP